MTYEEFINAKQKEVNELPLFFAFSDKQMDQQLAERGATRSDVYSLGNYGAFYLKKDKEIIRAYFLKEDKLPELMKDEQFAEDAFYYEMCNHEYGINWQADWDVCSCFASKELEYDEEKDWRNYLEESGLGYCRKSYSKALMRYREDAMNNEWF